MSVKMKQNGKAMGSNCLAMCLPPSSVKQEPEDAPEVKKMEPTFRPPPLPEPEVLPELLESWSQTKEEELFFIQLPDSLPGQPPTQEVRPVKTEMQSEDGQSVLLKTESQVGIWVFKYMVQRARLLCIRSLCMSVLCGIGGAAGGKQLSSEGPAGGSGWTAVGAEVWSGSAHTGACHTRCGSGNLVRFPPGQREHNLWLLIVG